MEFDFHLQTSNSDFSSLEKNIGAVQSSTGFSKKFHDTNIVCEVEFSVLHTFSRMCKYTSSQIGISLNFYRFFVSYSLIDWSGGSPMWTKFVLAQIRLLDQCI